MSYSCDISFKVIKEGDIYPFFQSFKKEVNSKFKEIAEDNKCWMPSIRNEHLYREIPDNVKEVFDMYPDIGNAVASYVESQKASMLPDGSICPNNSCLVCLVLTSTCNTFSTLLATSKTLAIKITTLKSGREFLSLRK